MPSAFLSPTLSVILTHMHALTHAWKPHNQLEPSGLLDAAVVYLLKEAKKKGSGSSTGTETWGILFHRPWEVCESSHAQKIGAVLRLLIDCQQFVRQSRHIGAPTKAVFVAGPGFLASSALRSACFQKRHWRP